MCKKNVLYIPLDDRPVNLSFVNDLGGLAHLNILTPPKELLGSFFQEGNSLEIANWIMGSTGDVLIISLDMLLYGGLIASRKPNREVEEAYKLIETLKSFKIKNPKIKIYAFSNIMRLSISIEGDDSEVWWRKINKYNELRYKVEILGDISLSDELIKLTSEIPEKVLDNYLESRKRNHIFNIEAVNLVKENIIDFLILSQEDCSPYGLHWIEHKTINTEINKFNLNEKVFIYPGADEIGQMLVARYINDEENWYPKVYIQYDDDELSSRVPKFEDRPLRVNVEEHLKSLGIMSVNEVEESDFVLAITTPNIPFMDMAEDDMTNYCKKHIINTFVEKIKNYSSKGKIVALADLTCSNGGDSYLINELVNQTILLKVAAYSAWNTAGNALGTAIVHGNIISTLIRRGELTKEKCKNSLKFILERYLDDYLYQSIIRKDTVKVVKDENLSIFNMGKTSEKVNMFVKDSLQVKANDLFNNKYVNYLNLNGKITDLKVDAILPWNRTFEAECVVKVNIQEVKSDS